MNNMTVDPYGYNLCDWNSNLHGRSHGDNSKGGQIGTLNTITSNNLRTIANLNTIKNLSSSSSSSSSSESTDCTMTKCFLIGLLILSCAVALSGILIGAPIAVILGSAAVAVISLVALIALWRN